MWVNYISIHLSHFLRQAISSPTRLRKRSRQRHSKQPTPETVTLASPLLPSYFPLRRPQHYTFPSNLANPFVQLKLTNTCIQSLLHYHPATTLVPFLYQNSGKNRISRPAVFGWTKPAEFYLILSFKVRLGLLQRWLPSEFDAPASAQSFSQFSKRFASLRVLRRPFFVSFHSLYLTKDSEIYPKNFTLLLC